MPLVSISVGATTEMRSLYTVALVYVYNSLQNCAHKVLCELCDVSFFNPCYTVDWGPSKT